MATITRSELNRLARLEQSSRRAAATGPAARRIALARRLYGPDHPAYRRVLADPSGLETIRGFRLDMVLAPLRLHGGTAALRKFLDGDPEPFALRRLELDLAGAVEPMPIHAHGCKWCADPERGHQARGRAHRATRARSGSRSAGSGTRSSSGGGGLPRAWMRPPGWPARAGTACTWP